METTEATDTELRNAIVNEMRWIPSINSTNIGVAVIDGAVTLSGEVDSYPQKRQAEKAALRVGGVNAVAEEITVRSSWAGANDTDIARQAGEALERAVDIPTGSIKATVTNHKITLTGVASWQYQRLAAARAVRYLRGVTAVVNEVTIHPEASPDGIKEAISGALVRSAQLAGANIAVTAVAGVVTLAGEVHTWAERHQADLAAWSAPGVTAVNNQLQIDRHFTS